MEREEVRVEGSVTTEDGGTTGSVPVVGDVNPSIRDDKGRFVKGIAPNPSGRRKTPAAFKALAESASVECLQAVIEIARDKRMRAADRIRAAELVCAYGVGKPVQTVDLQGADAPKVILLDM